MGVEVRPRDDAPGQAEPHRRAMRAMQLPTERLTRSAWKRQQAKARRRQEAAWAAKCGPVTTRIDPELARLHRLVRQPSAGGTAGPS